MNKQTHISVAVQPKGRPAKKRRPKGPVKGGGTPRQKEPSDLEYLKLFDTCEITASKLGEVDKMIDEKILPNRSRYETVVNAVHGGAIKTGFSTQPALGGFSFFQPRNFYQTPTQLPEVRIGFPGIESPLFPNARRNPFNLGMDLRTVYAGAARIPWFFIACAHYHECNFNFKLHLHNGDPLTGYTVREPARRPQVGHPPPFTWEESAVDAMRYMKFDTRTNWNMARILRDLESYNGFGYYFYKKMNTPYLWSYSNHYTKGKYVADRKFDAVAVSAQAGAAVILKRMEQRGLIYIPRF